MSRHEPLHKLRSGVGCLLDRPTPDVAAALRALDWNFETGSSDELTHALHPYPAKFIPQLPRQAIATLSRPGDLVLDPFSGGGTTAVEAAVAGRSAYVIDANPVGNAIARAKTTPLTPHDAAQIRLLEEKVLALDSSALLEAESAWLPTIPNLEKWYDAAVFRALGTVRELVIGVERQTARELALVAFVQAAARLSFQDSETRYSSKPRPMSVLEVPRAVLGELRRMTAAASRLSLTSIAAGSVEIVEGDAREAGAYELLPRSAGLIITSPPYPNAYDYHLYHRFRLFWLGRDPRELRRLEIGSHLKNQASADPKLQYVDDMGRVLENCWSALAPGRFAVFVVGDGVFSGEIFETSERLTLAARALGFEAVTTIERKLPVHRRSVTHAGRRLAVEDVLVFRRPVVQEGGNRRRQTVVTPNWSLAPYERELQLRELQALGGAPSVGPTGDVMVAPNERLQHAAFVHAYRTSDGVNVPTFQALMEAPEPGSRRKNSTYLAHGIHRYKGKFYPQLAKSLLNISGVQRGRSLILDPFGGSGTVALEAVLNGFDAASFDTNPLAVAITRAKVGIARADARSLLAFTERLNETVRRAPKRGRGLDSFDADMLPELERWFPAPALRKLAWLIHMSREQTDQLVKDTLLVLMSDIVREVSQQEPRDLRIRRRRIALEDAPVYETFQGRVRQLEDRLRAHMRIAEVLPRLGSAQAILGDSGAEETFAELGGRLVDAVVSSPPYAAALPYIDTDRLSLAALFGHGTRSRRHIESVTIGSREIGERDRTKLEAELEGELAHVLPATTVGFLRDYRQAVAADSRAGFRLRQGPAVLTRYFKSMHRVLTTLRPHMRAGAAAYFVLGDSRSTVAGEVWRVPTTDEVAAIAEAVGFILVNRLPISVTREAMVHARHAITRNEILLLRAP